MTPREELKEAWEVLIVLTLFLLQTVRTLTVEDKVSGIEPESSENIETSSSDSKKQTYGRLTQGSQIKPNYGGVGQVRSYFVLGQQSNGYGEGLKSKPLAPGRISTPVQTPRRPLAPSRYLPAPPPPSYSSAPPPPRYSYAPASPSYSSAPTRPGYLPAPVKPDFPSAPTRPGYLPAPIKPDFPSAPTRPGYLRAPVKPGFPSAPVQPDYSSAPVPSGSLNPPSPPSYSTSTVPAGYLPRGQGHRTVVLVPVQSSRPYRGQQDFGPSYLSQLPRPTVQLPGYGAPEPQSLSKSGYRPPRTFSQPLLSYSGLTGSNGANVNLYSGPSEPTQSGKSQFPALTVLLAGLIRGGDVEEPGAPVPKPPSPGFFRFYFAQPKFKHGYGYGKQPEGFQSRLNIGPDGRPKNLNFGQPVQGGQRPDGQLPYGDAEGGLQQDLQKQLQRNAPYLGPGPNVGSGQPPRGPPGGGRPDLESLYGGGQQQGGPLQRPPASFPKQASPYSSAIQGLRGVSLGAIAGEGGPQGRGPGAQFSPAGISLAALKGGVEGFEGKIRSAAANEGGNGQQRSYGPPPRGFPPVAGPPSNYFGAQSSQNGVKNRGAANLPIGVAGVYRK
ncbi:basic salivary proline-rich protein 1-like [Limulus polyphemus]|uniref:Basic salivary proline-rich protein 1-like n=1 Tax=Limulus polyphemus TaxID=6850 RepID=A0ABM1BZQ5_LIMPO|nr:basic salivary proline-rich protein 1-like [Limulus polyphemus]